MTAATPDGTEVLTAPEAAALLRLNLKSLYKLVDEGKVPCSRIGPRRLRFLRTSLLAWLAGRESTSRTRRSR